MATTTQKLSLRPHSQLQVNKDGRVASLIYARASGVPARTEPGTEPLIPPRGAGTNDTEVLAFAHFKMTFMFIEVLARNL